MGGFFFKFVPVHFLLFAETVKGEKEGDEKDYDYEHAILSFLGL